MSTEVMAKAHERAPQRARPQGAETQVRQLLRARSATTALQERRAAALELHKARQKAKAERLERAAVKAAPTGRVGEWREAHRAPRTLPRVFEGSTNPTDWADRLKSKAVESMSISSELDLEWVAAHLSLPSGTTRL